ncbi:MAG: spore germination protein GerW family protein [Nitriliruptoraceae bacterium]
METATPPGGPSEPGEVVPPVDAGANDPVIRLARRVVGTPIEHDGAVMVPVSSVLGGSGGGSGADTAGNHGQGGGWGGRARPVGAYVLEQGRVRYEPAVDITRLAGLATTVLVVLVLFTRCRRPRTRR